MTVRIFLSTLILFTLFSCQQEKAKNDRTANNKDVRLLIKKDSYMGVSPGDDIDRHKKNLRKAKMENGEGEFEVFLILDAEQNNQGYILPDVQNPSKVRSIYIGNKEAETQKGIRRGSTFAEVQAAYPDIVVNGSEIEGRTFAKTGQIYFQLNTAIYSYEVDLEKIPKTAKVTRIQIGI